VLRRAGSLITGAARVDLAMLGREDVLDAQIVPPAVGEVVVGGEPLANPETEA
jgi:hypothetical protein